MAGVQEIEGGVSTSLCESFGELFGLIGGADLVMFAGIDEDFAALEIEVGDCGGEEHRSQ